MRALLRVSGAIDAFTEWLGKLSGVLATLVILVGFYNVLARYIGRFLGMQLTSNTFIELQWYIFAVIFFLGFAYILRHNLNVRVDVFYAHWSPRRKALINILGTLLFLLPFCVIGILVTINPVLLSWGRLPNGRWGVWEVSPDPGGLPRAPIKSMIIVAFALLAIQGISELIKHVAIYTGVAAADVVEESDKPAGGIE
ncbi:MAG TPA: TRAP transporter small permease subunit [Roseiflexaceae bacterium]|nr:TRAP transporter small permease subunit [Roseiflexaceae bacterium]